MNREQFLVRLTLASVCALIAFAMQPALAQDVVLLHHEYPFKNCIRVPDWSYTVDVMDMWWEMHRDECEFFGEITVTQTMSTHEPYNISEPLEEVTTVTVCPAGDVPIVCIAHVTMSHPDIEYRAYHLTLDARSSDGRLQSQGGGWLPNCTSAKALAQCGEDWVLRMSD